MPKVAKVIGGAGTGKTTHLLGLMEWWASESGGNLSPLDLGMVSFTRAAREEACQRAVSQLGISRQELDQSGWFRTIHACCARLLAGQAGDLLSDKVADKRWIAEATGAEITGTATPETQTDGDAATVDDKAGKRDGDIALALWDCARNTMQPFEHIWQRADRCYPQTPAYETCVDIVSQYEQRKRLDNRCDYTDLLSQYVGVRFEIGGPVKTSPKGAVPALPVWFLDEWQDASELLNMAGLRLTSDADWVYVCGDPFQSIYGFAGSNPKHFLAWQATAGHERILPQTFRCPEPVLTLGENILRPCDNYFDRGIAPAPHAGEVNRIGYGDDWPSRIDPRTGDWLLLARTNFLASRLASRINAMSLPWVGAGNIGSVWSAPQRNKALRGLIDLEQGGVINAAEWQAAVKLMPSKLGDTELLPRGQKKHWEGYCGDPADLTDLEHLTMWGATPELVSKIRSGSWRGRGRNPLLIPHADKFYAAWQEWGHEAVLSPKVKIGTIHGTKGMQADNVLLMTTLTQQIMKGMEDADGLDEERRVWYVAVTRTKQRLYCANESTENKWKLPI